MPLQTIVGTEIEPGYVTWNDSKTLQAALSSATQALDKSQIMPTHTRAALSNTFKGIDGPASVRTGMTRNDYEFFRPAESIPRHHREIIRVCLEAYEHVGVVRHVIDLMSEFASQGIRLVHPNKSVERFFKTWFAFVSGPERSERFVNTLYKAGNVIIRKRTAKLSQSKVDEFKRTVGKADMEIDESTKVSKREVPGEYVFIHPGIVQIRNPANAIFTGKREFYIQPSTISSNFLNEVDNLPANIVTNSLGNESIDLDPDKTSVYYYKKDDWKLWALPMTYAVLEDLIMLKKLKLADLTALDGAISHVRMWKLGSLEHKILPNNSAINKLSDILLNHVGGGTMDLIWGPDIELIETSTDLSNILGREKYGPVMDAIYSGLGIPPALVAGGGGPGGMTGSYMSIRAFIERLNYGRMLLTDFWTKEVQAVTKAMGFRTPPTILFDTMNLADESNEKMLWINLADRNIISWESVQEKFGRIPEIESYRTLREEKGRETGKVPTQIGPFVGTDNESQFKKMAMQSGISAPSEVGLELNDKKDGEESLIDKQQKMAELSKPPGQPGQGRPKNSNDKNKRKQKVVKPSTKAFFDLTQWANIAQDVISEALNPVILKHFNKKNMRSLTDAEYKMGDKLKKKVFFNTEPFSNIDDVAIGKIAAGELKVYNIIEEIAQQFITQIRIKTSAEPTVDIVKNANSYAYAIYKGDFDGED
jgi:hypothetical protein